MYIVFFFECFFLGTFHPFPFQSARYCNQKLLVRVEIPGSAPLLFPGEVNAQGALRFGGDPAEAAVSPVPPSALEENNAWVERWSDGFLLEDIGMDVILRGWTGNRNFLERLASGVSLDELENLKKED
jgi:hypothetical protein